MQTSSTPVWARDHTFFGVCEALGEDLGFSPVFLRVAFALGLFFAPLGMIAAYAGLGLLVAFTRFVSPNPRRAEVAETEARPVEADRTEAQAEPDMALAA